MPRVFESSQTLIAPSILSADMARLDAEVQDALSAGADWMHVDVMDGHFVPNITMGPVVVEGLRPKTDVVLDCHLMVARPEHWIEPFSVAGADVITIHIEAAPQPKNILKNIRRRGVRSGLSLNPDTPVDSVMPYLDDVDLVLVMSVHPGFSGQGFLEGCVEKVKALKAARGDRPFLIEIDGGVSPKNAKMLREAGCDVMVAGSSVFGKPDRKAAVQAFREALGESAS